MFTGSYAITGISLIYFNNIASYTELPQRAMNNKQILKNIFKIEQQNMYR